MKLAARPADLPALQDALEAMSGGRRAASSRLVSTYFDTADRALRRSGLVLRVRQRDGEFVQAVKSDPVAGGNPLTRGEWEDRIAGPQPDCAAAHSGRLIAATAAKGLHPLFATEVTRAAVDLAPAPTTLIEAAIDRGRLRNPAGGTAEPISEIELELKGGDCTVLYEVALRLLDVAPLRIARQSKAERGYRLIAGKKSAKAVHAAPVALDPAMAAGAGLQRIGRACLDHLLANEAAVLAGKVEGIHQMRVAARRLRAVLTAFGKLLPGKERRRASEELRWLANTLDEVRNLDVFAGGLLRQGREAIADPAALQALAAAVARRRRAAHAAAAQSILSTRYTDALLQLLRWFEAGQWGGGRRAGALRRPLGEIVPPLLDGRRRAVKKRGKGFLRQTARQRHRLRIALKTLRYATDLLGGLYGDDDTGRFAKQLRRLQDVLGEANDVRVGRDIVAALGVPGGGGAKVAETGRRLIDWHERRVAAREAELRDELRRLLKSTPFWRR